MEGEDEHLDFKGILDCDGKEIENFANNPNMYVEEVPKSLKATGWSLDEVDKYNKMTKQFYISQILANKKNVGLVLGDTKNQKVVLAIFIRVVGGKMKCKKLIPLMDGISKIRQKVIVQDDDILFANI